MGFGFVSFYRGGFSPQAAGVLRTENPPELIAVAV